MIGPWVAVKVSGWLTVICVVGPMATPLLPSPKIAVASAGNVTAPSSETRAPFAPLIDAPPICRTGVAPIASSVVWPIDSVPAPAPMPIEVPGLQAAMSTPEGAAIDAAPPLNGLRLSALAKKSTEPFASVTVLPVCCVIPPLAPSTRMPLPVIAIGAPAARTMDPATIESPAVVVTPLTPTTAPIVRAPVPP